MNAPAIRNPTATGSPELDVVEAVQGGEAVGMPSLGILVEGLGAALGNKRRVGKEVGRFGQDVVRIALGRSSLTPARGDRRFADEAWQENPLFRRLGQGYLAFGSAIQRLVDALEEDGCDWHRAEKARFAANIVVSAASPTNTLLTNPAAMKRAFDTGGASLVSGVRHLVSDMRFNGGMPSQTNKRAFQVGRDLAVTPGSVIHRDDVAEVIRYTPATDTVYARPLVIVPPPIGRYYFLDLRPGRSFVEYAVSKGFQVYLVSWRNPTASMGHWGMDTYAARILSAIDVAREVSASPDVNVIGFCAGGILSSTVLNHLADKGDDRVHSAAFGVTLLDFDSRAPLGAFSTPRLLELARQGSERDGIIKGEALGKVFAWMRPDDLVFNYWVNNYLLGHAPPTFDILAWNADSTNLPAQLHAQFIDVFKRNTLAEGATLRVLGSDVRLDQIKVPTFVTGALTDHLTPWAGTFRTTELLSGPSTFVLSNAGHIASLVNPPGNAKASYYYGGKLGDGPDAWLRTAKSKTGTWWEPWAAWTAKQSGERIAPPPNDDMRYQPLQPAPGAYVTERVRK